MHPVLFEIPRIGSFGPIPIRMYGLMIGIGFLLGVYLASRQARKQGIDPDRILDMGVYMLFAAIVGSRLLYVFTNLSEFSRSPLEVFAIWKGGLVFYGGLLAAVPTGLWYVRRYGLPVWETADIVAPYIALAHGFGRLGCFFAGCCYGELCAGSFCITYSDPRALAPIGVPLVPTQLLESGGEFIIFGLLLLLRKHAKYPGRIFWLYPLFYAVMRFILEFFRGDAVRGLYFGGIVSTSQLIAVFMALFSSFMLWKLSRKAGRSSTAA